MVLSFIGFCESCKQQNDTWDTLCSCQIWLTDKDTSGLLDTTPAPAICDLFFERIQTSRAYNRSLNYAIRINKIGEGNSAYLVCCFDLAIFVQEHRVLNLVFLNERFALMSVFR